MGNKLLLLITVSIILSFLDNSNSLECKQKYGFSELQTNGWEPEESTCWAEEYCVFVQVNEAYDRVHEKYVEGTFHYCAKEYDDHTIEFCDQFRYNPKKIKPLTEFIIKVEGKHYDLVEGNIKAFCCTKNNCNEDDDGRKTIETEVKYRKCKEGLRISYYNEDGEVDYDQHDYKISQCSTEEYCMHVKAELSYDSIYGESRRAKGDFWKCVTDEIEKDFCENHDFNQFYRFDKFHYKWPEDDLLEPKYGTIQASCCDDYNGFCNNDDDYDDNEEDIYTNEENMDSMGTRYELMGFIVTLILSVLCFL